MKGYIDAQGKIGNEPKALIDIFGLSLLERKIIDMGDKGITEFGIICGENRHKIEQFISKKKLGSRFDIEFIDSGEGVEKTDVGDVSGFNIIGTEDVKKYEKILLKDASHHPQEDFVTLYITRKISRRLAVLLSKTGLTPNGITLLKFFAHVIAGFLFCFGRYEYTLLAAFFLNLAWILDCTDGIVAKLKHMTSKFGAWFDSVTDFVGEPIWIIGATIGMYNQSGSNLAWIVGLLMLFTMYITLAKSHFNLSIVEDRSHPLVHMDKDSGKKIRILGALRERISKYHISLGPGNKLLIITIGAIFNKLLYAFLVIIALSTLIWIIAFAVIVSQRNKL